MAQKEMAYFVAENEQYFAKITCVSKRRIEVRKQVPLSRGSGDPGIKPFLWAM